MSAPKLARAENIKKIQSTGWQPKVTIEQGIVKTLRWLEANRWVYEARQ